MSAQRDKYKFLSRPKAMGKLRKPKSTKQKKARKNRSLTRRA